MSPAGPRPPVARVLLVGAGGLGCGAAPVLAAAPFPLLVEVVDDDHIERGNLHRQVLHAEADAGRSKAESLARAIDRMAAQRGTAARAAPLRVTADNALPLVRSADLVLDGSDNFPTRFLLNDACVVAGVRLVHAAAIRWQGQLLAVEPRPADGAAPGPCYRCLFEAPPIGGGAGCAEAGIAGPVAGLVGALAAELALALLAGAPACERADGGAAIGRLLVFDGLAGRVRTVRFRRNPACRACGAGPLVEPATVLPAWPVRAETRSTEEIPWPPSASRPRCES